MFNVKQIMKVTMLNTDSEKLVLRYLISNIVDKYFIQIGFAQVYH